MIIVNAVKILLVFEEDAFFRMTNERFETIAIT